MKHAGNAALASLQPVLTVLREQRALVERTPGSFYFRSKAFIHFHEDTLGLFADLKEDLVSFSRYRVSTRAEQRALIARIKQCLNAARASNSGEHK